jgi:branched-chain amino acid aminotransferase
MAQFVTVFCDTYVSARYENGRWQDATMQATAPIEMHPAAHVFHYASTCFEGFKAYRWQDGKARIFRLPDHVARMQRSAVDFPSSLYSINLKIRS